MASAKEYLDKFGVEAAVAKAVTQVPGAALRSASPSATFCSAHRRLNHSKPAARQDRFEVTTVAGCWQPVAAGPLYQTATQGAPRDSTLRTCSTRPMCTVAITGRSAWLVGEDDMRGPGRAKAAGRTRGAAFAYDEGRPWPTTAAPGDHDASRYTYAALPGLCRVLQTARVECVDPLTATLPAAGGPRRRQRYVRRSNRLKSEGKILHWGVSVETVEEAMLAIAQPQCATIQIIYNMLRQRPSEASSKRRRRRTSLSVYRSLLVSRRQGG